MSNIIFAGMPNHSDGGTITSGSEVATLPDTNLQDRQIRKVWRTTNDTPANTWIQVDYGTAKLTGVIALINHNLSNQATWRIRLSNDSSFTTSIYDSGAIEARPEIEAFGALPWGEFHWGGKLSDAELEGITINSFHIVSPDQVLARYMRIDFSDESNPDTYIEAGRLISGAAVQPTLNMQYNWQIGFEDPSVVSKSIGGQTYIDELERYRVLRFVLRDLPEDEMFSNFFDILDRRKGISGDLLVIPQPDNTTQIWNQAFYGRMRVLDPVSNPYFGAFDKGFEIEELL